MKSHSYHFIFKCQSLLVACIMLGLFFSGRSFAAEMAADAWLEHAVNDVFAPARPESVRIEGRLGKKMELCLTNRLLAQDIALLVNPYREKSETGGADWRCEYWGKWFTSLALADAYHSTPAIRDTRDEAVRELLTTAAPDGYLGTRQPQYRLQGWDVWGCKYVLLGLIADYDRTRDPAVLEAARRETDVLIAELGPGKTDIADVGEWNGLPASSVLEPVILVYERTGERKYLDFGEYIVACWSKPSQRLPGGMRLIEDALAGKNPDQMCAPKAYEMMSCFEGLCELYRATGKRDYLDAAIKIADGVEREEATLVGPGTSSEVWFDGADKQSGVVEKPMETCVTVTWMKLCDQLLRLTGDARYADELEKNLYNGLLGAMMPDGNWWAYFDGLMGVRVPSYVQHADVGLSCCVCNGPRGLMLTPFWAFMQSADGPVVNLYAPGTAQLGDVKLVISGDYPVSDRVAIRVTPARTEEFTLTLRIPAWSQHTELAVNGKPVSVTPGYTKIRRTWHPNDRVQIAFDMRPRVVTLNDDVALLRGPIVLSLDNRLTPAGTGRLTIDPHPELIPDPVAAKKIGAWMAFDVDGLTFCDYASAGNAFSERNCFRTWLPQPLDLATLYETGQTWQTLTHASYWTDPPRPPLRVEDPKHDLALAVNGATATSDSEYSREPGCTAEAIDGVIATPDDFSDRWHSSIETPHPHWIEVHLPRPSEVSRAIIHFADPKGYPVSFEGAGRLNGQEHQIFKVADNHDAFLYQAKFAPVKIDSFRLTINVSANPAYPNAAQISEIEIYK
ncbi:MAG TPA: beta-L-arabinofuranosidase domain-containing protein [Candidatus Saccharimonadales bacterium]|nr:beta-L-arabinofuranosidase domain-containing protein [Candidatus Saccharimonadales bacterium]